MSLPLDDAAAPDEPSYWDQLGEEPPPEPADWSGDELEQAYLRAIEVLEASEAELPDVVVLEAASSDDLPQPTTASASSTSDTQARRETPTITAAERAEATEDLKRLAARHTAAAALSDPDASERPGHCLQHQPPAVLPQQILEACLFVGGDALTAKKLSGVLRGEFSVEYIERELDELNTLYTSEGRPYEIRLGDGGYRLTLRDDFERIRNKAYGLGPKEVRLSQEALEVLAVVAYHQPISAIAIEELGKSGSGAVLRQLLRRELIAVERRLDQPRDVAYLTTPRFLSLFGIRSLDELPRHEQVGYK